MANTLATWVNDVRGLNPGVTLFTGPDYGGLRLRSGQAMYPGRVYYLVAKEAPVLPSFLHPRALGSNNGWQGWKIHIPEVLSKNDFKAVAGWCQKIGGTLRELHWRIMLLSPPAYGYNSEGYPLLPLGSQAIFEVIEPTNPIHGTEEVELELHQSEHSIPPKQRARLVRTSECLRGRHFVSVNLNKVGHYMVREKEGRTKVIRFAVTEQRALSLDVSMVQERK